MQVIAHDGKSQNLHRKDARQKFQSLPDPIPAVRVILSGLPIPAAQMRPADTAVDNMENLNFPIRNDLLPIDPWHTLSLRKKRY
jgi:hypothetical protein